MHEQVILGRIERVGRWWMDGTQGGGWDGWALDDLDVSVLKIVLTLSSFFPDERFVSLTTP